MGRRETMAAEPALRRPSEDGLYEADYYARLFKCESRAISFQNTVRSRSRRSSIRNSCRSVGGRPKAAPIFLLDLPQATPLQDGDGCSGGWLRCGGRQAAAGSSRSKPTTLLTSQGVVSGQFLTCAPAEVLPMAQRCFLF